MKDRRPTEVRRRPIAERDQNAQKDMVQPLKAQHWYKDEAPEKAGNQPEFITRDGHDFALLTFELESTKSDTTKRNQQNDESSIEEEDEDDMSD